MIMQEMSKETVARMSKCLDVLKNALAKVRTGRANAGLLDHIKVSSYGNEMPLNQVASVSVEGARSLVVTAWDKTQIPAIEKAILTSDLGLNPVTAGNVIRVPMPALNEERRRELVKIVREEVENAKIAVRNVRRDSNQALKDQLKAKTLNEDEERRGQTEIQKQTDKFIAEIDKLLATKEAELMEI
ncbi:MAG: ribosome recycling factor [Gammaproteobacteria bacterium]